MMATHEELEAAAAAFLDKYLVDSSVYSTKADIAASAASAKDQGHDIEAGTTGGSAAAAESGGQQQRKRWMGKHEDKEVAKTAGWFKQCRWAGRNTLATPRLCGLGALPCCGMQ
jgi:hypothetical protein